MGIWQGFVFGVPDLVEIPLNDVHGFVCSHHFWFFSGFPTDIWTSARRFRPRVVLDNGQHRQHDVNVDLTCMHANAPVSVCVTDCASHVLISFCYFCLLLHADLEPPVRTVEFQWCSHLTHSCFPVQPESARTHTSGFDTTHSSASSAMFVSLHTTHSHGGEVSLFCSAP